MNILNIVVISIFIIFVITYIIMISTLNLNPSMSSDNDNEINNLLKKRDSDINNLNIIGTIVGILISVIDINYINKLQITNRTLIIGLNIFKLIIYVTLLGLAGTAYSDYYKLMEIEYKLSEYESSSPSDSFPKNIVDNSAKWAIAIKPLVPFLCALSIQTLLIIITNLENKIPYDNIPSSESPSSVSI
jgi:hypothetical protein